MAAKLLEISPASQQRLANNAPAEASFKGRKSAFSLVASFATEIQKQLKVVSCLEAMADCFGLESVILLRGLSDESHHRVIARMGRTDQNGAFHEGLDRTISDFSIKPGAIVAQDKTTILLVLRAEVGSVDLLHLRFTDAVCADGLSTLTDMAPALATAWAERPPGYASRMIAAQRETRRTRPDDRSDAAILDAENRFGLSRSEFRVCQLLGEGLRPIEIARALDLSIATVRTHLSGIYAKTELSGQIEVLRYLKLCPAAA